MPDGATALQLFLSFNEGLDYEFIETYTDPAFTSNEFSFYDVHTCRAFVRAVNAGPASTDGSVVSGPPEP